MEEKPRNTSKEALDWMKKIQKKDGLVLFRGQNKIHPSIHPTLFRPYLKEFYNGMKILCDNSKRFASGINGTWVAEKHQAIAIIQHYLEISPILDLTGTSHVALYFALLNADPQIEHVIYAFEVSLLEELKVVEHDFLLLAFGDKGEKSRWWRQDGFGVYSEYFSDFNLLSHPHQSFTFWSSQSDMKLINELGDLLSIEDDPIARDVYGTIQAVSSHFNITETIQNVYSKYDYPNVINEEASEFDEWIKKARVCKLKSEEKKLLRLKDQFVNGIFETAHWAEFEEIVEKIKNNCTISD